MGKGNINNVQITNIQRTYMYLDSSIAREEPNACPAAGYNRYNGVDSSLISKSSAVKLSARVRLFTRVCAASLLTTLAMVPFSRWSSSWVLLRFFTNLYKMFIRNVVKQAKKIANFAFIINSENKSKAAWKVVNKELGLKLWLIKECKRSNQFVCYSL